MASQELTWLILTTFQRAVHYTLLDCLGFLRTYMVDIGDLQESSTLHTSDCLGFLRAYMVDIGDLQESSTPHTSGLPWLLGLHG